MRVLFVTIMAICILPAFIAKPVIAKEPGALISGAYLLGLCSRDVNGQETAPGAHIACQSYIAGLIDYHNLLRSLGTAPNIDLCVPNTVKLKDLQDMVWKYLNENNHHDSFIAAPAVTLALFERFPCDKKKKK